ncbi:MAG TPA: alpha/beta hydrolase [Balneolaceae bacterium]|nr:alpha/beta hydrolase [Balneolaceae bacterium]
MKKLKTTLTTIAITAFFIAPAILLAQDDKGKNGYASVNGLNYYYEIHGQGDLSTEASAQAEPILLLHGGLGSGEMFNPILPQLTEYRQIIVVDLHGHGRTALGERELNIIDMGDDIAAILKELGYDKVDVLGYSMGGGVGFQFAVQHPEMVRKLVMVGVVFSRDGYYPEILKQQIMVNADAAEMMKNTPMYQSYKKLAPHPEDFPKLLEQIGELMAEPFDYSEDVKKLEMPVMLIYPDAGMIKPEHMVDFYQLLGGGLRDAGWNGQFMSQNRLAILPGLTHYNIFMSPEMVETALTFLYSKNETKNWSEQVNEAGN